MPAKIITLSQKDQDLLRVALGNAIEWERERGTDDALCRRITELKERLV